MAEVVLSLVLKHLDDVAMEEVKLLSGVHRDVNEFGKSLKSIEALLKDAERIQDSREDVKEWVRQVRNVAYDIEDVVDEFLFRVGPKQPHQPGFGGCFRRFGHCIRQLSARHRIGIEVKRITGQLQAIEVRKNMFSSSSLVSKIASPSASYDTRRLTEPQFIEHSNIVGFEKPERELTLKLLEEDSVNFAVISVLGMAGLGKTTLVRKIYQSESVRRGFSCFAWVTVSRSFSASDILRGIFNSFMGRRKEHFSSFMGENFTGFGEYSHEEIDHMDHAQLVDGLKAYMRKNRYVVVLDDVWTIDAWEALRYVFPENGLRSRIVITTRRHDVALSCSRSQENVHKMEPLREEEAWTLFCSKAFCGSCPPELEAQSMNILKICEGLPLAIVTMGGLLVTKPLSPTEWNKVLENLTVTLDKNEATSFMNQVLWLGYDDLPHYLKYCFLYFGSYPEDFEVYVYELIPQWIAEGFIRPGNRQTQEELAHDYLCELVHRSLVEVVTYDVDGSIGSCRIHDIMHRLILQKMKKEHFLTLATEDMNPNEEVRRLSVNSSNNALWGRNFTRLRTLSIFNATELPTWSSFRLLRVLNLKRVQIDEFPNPIVRLHHLTYLNLSHTSIDMIPKSIRKLHKLQTLFLHDTNIWKLPDEILYLHALRHLKLLCTFRSVTSASTKQEYWDASIDKSTLHSLQTTNGAIDSLAGVTMPISLGTLKCLYELSALRMDGGEKQAIELGKLTELRNLMLTAVQRQNWDGLCNSIVKMVHLKFLTIITNEDEEEPFHIDFMSALSTTLLVMCFVGRLSNLPGLSAPFFSIVKLVLVDSGLSEDPLKSLQHLPMLKELALSNAFIGEEISCRENGYKRLERFVIKRFNQLKSVYIRKGAMPKLEVMVINRCWRLDGVPFGLENLKALRNLSFFDMLREFIQKVREKDGKEHDKMKHIPRVRHFFDDDDGRPKVEELSSWI